MQSHQSTDYSAQHNCEVIDLTDKCGTSPMQQLVSFPCNKNDMQFPTHLFVNIAPEWADHLPDDIDGVKVFKIKWLPRDNFRMHSSRKKCLIGTRKGGRCLGNLYFPYNKCAFKISAGKERST